MKNLTTLKSKAKKISRTEMKSFNGGLKWTGDRGGCVEDRRNLALWIESMRNMPVCCTLRTC